MRLPRANLIADGANANDLPELAQHVFVRQAHHGARAVGVSSARGMIETTLPLKESCSPWHQVEGDIMQHPALQES